MPGSDANVPVQAEGVSGFEIQTLGANDHHYQINLPPDLSRSVDDPPPPSEADATGVQTVQVHMPRSVASVQMQAVGWSTGLGRSTSNSPAS